VQVSSPGDQPARVTIRQVAELAIAVPALTTVRQPLAELGRTAVSLLLRRLENRRMEPLRVELATRLVPSGPSAISAGLGNRWAPPPMIRAAPYPYR
jgi:DNA-binding LacI/PurR family transcriptional regulator